MANMDVFVMPSVHNSESFGVAAVQAQAMGVPVVASRVGSVAEAVLDQKTGLLVPPRDPGALSKAVLRLIENEDLRRSMSQEGPRFVTQWYDWQKNAGRVDELYTDLLSRSGGSRRP